MKDLMKLKYAQKRKLISGQVLTPVNRIRRQQSKLNLGRDEIITTNVILMEIK